MSLPRRRVIVTCSRCGVSRAEYERIVQLLAKLCSEVERNLGESAFGPVLTTLPMDVAQWWHEVCPIVVREDEIGAGAPEQA